MKHFAGITLNFSQQYLEATLIVSLLSVWVLVGLFYYLNHYTKREYFTVWTAAWLFYALWLTLCLMLPTAVPTDIVFKLKQCCVAISAAFLLWGSLRFLDLPVRQTLFGLFMLFLVVWTFLSPQVLSSAFQIELPVFILLGLGSVFAAVCFYRLRSKMPFVGAGMLALGFFLWGLYLASYPFSMEYGDLYSAGFLIAAVLQLFIAVSMIVLVLEEVRFHGEQVRAEIATVRSEKEALQMKVITTEEQCRGLYDQVRLTEGMQKAYEELRRTQQSVVQQERLRALGQMASGVAHDINNALSPIVAYSEMLKTMLTELEETPRRYLETIHKSSEDIAQIVARMREFYRRRGGTEFLRQLNINQTIEEVIDLTRPRWRDLPQRHGVVVQIERELDPKLPTLLSDASELREALTNLVFNAVDALPQGGKITFITRVIQAEDTDAPQEIQLEVRDNGIGMDERTRQRCLEPFFSTKAQRGGTGLGLSMVYGMMERHNGSIAVESATGQGTCVRLTFPMREKAQKSPSNVAPAIKPDRSLHILCIDDEIQIRQMLNDCLTNFKHRVTIAASGKNGIELFRAAKWRNRPFEVVITDLGMPEVDGNQVAQAIKAESPGTPVVMMTGWGTIMKDSGETGPSVDALIAKPPRMQELHDLLLRVTA